MGDYKFILLIVVIHFMTWNRSHTAIKIKSPDCKLRCHI